MTFEYLADASGTPAWAGTLPGRPTPYFLSEGEGEHAKLFGDHFTVLLSGDETQNQFGVITSMSPAGEAIPAHTHADTHEVFFVMEGKVRVFVEGPEGKASRLLLPGDFGFVPAGFAHAYQVEEEARMLGVLSGGFERFFQHMGTAVDRIDPATPPFIPDFPRMGAAAAQHRTEFHPQLQWPDV
jgi:quercetin 2,3-dioxygenase